MLWYKSWLDTRWQFLTGLALLVCSAIATVLAYPEVQRLLPSMTFDPATETGRRLQGAILLASEYRGYIWWEWFHSNLRNLAVFFAVLLGSTSSLTASKGALFTLSLPVSRRQLVNARTIVGLVEVFVLAVAPSMLIPVLSAIIREGYGATAALIHGLCAAVVVATFFLLALWLSTIFEDLWRPLVISLAIAFGLSFVDRSMTGILSAETYFRYGRLPWIGLIANAAVAAAMYFAAGRSLARREF